MGTRNLTAVFLDGKRKVAQYGQWDGYPSGQGATVLGFLAMVQREQRMDEFKSKVRGCTFIEGDEVERRWKEAGADDSGLVSMDVASKFAERYPQLSRDAGAGVLHMILNSANGLELDDSWEFGKDGLFCEYAYVLDLDANRLELYTGFHKDAPPAGQRFADGAKASDSGYYPIHMVGSWPLDALPTVEDMEIITDPEEAIAEE